MTRTTKQDASLKANTLTVERLFDATPETLWAYWTDPSKFAVWFNPAPGQDLVVHEYDVRVGGHVRFDMPQPDGNKNPQEGVFHVVEPHRRIVSGSPDGSFRVDTTFTKVGKRTRMTVTVTGVPREFHDGATKGWNAGFDKLEAALARGEALAKARQPLSLTLHGDREIEITCVLDAPRDRVFRAYTDPKAIERWWGPRRLTTTVVTQELRPGGSWRYLNHEADGTEYGFHGEFLEVAPPKRLAWTFEFEGAPGHVSRESVDFLEMPGGRTKVVIRTVYANAADREAMIRSGMESGLRESMERLEELLEEVERRG